MTAQFESSALVSHVDFLPTIASFFGPADSARADWQGVDYSELIRDPSAAPVQDTVHGPAAGLHSETVILRTR